MRSTRRTLLAAAPSRALVVVPAEVANTLMLPPPAWFRVAGLLVPLAAGALTAGMVRAKKPLPE